MRPAGFKPHHVTLQKLFSGGLKRIIIPFLIIPLIPLAMIEIYSVLYPASDIHALINELVTIYLGITAAATCVYVITHYSHIRKSLKSVSDLAQFGDQAAKVAHDLRSPLAGLKSVVKSFQKISTKDSAVLASVDLLELSVRKLEAIAQDVLSTHKNYQDGKSLLDVHQLLDELIWSFSSQPQYSGIQFHTQYTQQALLFQGHETHLSRMFQNLFKNSIEAMKGKGSMWITTKLDEFLATISIQDSGPGMSERVIQNVMAGPYTEGKSHGHGLGLATVHEVLERHGGKLTIASTPGQGACFQIILPLHHVDLAAKPAGLAGYPLR